jgi:hypothetical protein
VVAGNATDPDAVLIKAVVRAHRYNVAIDGNVSGLGKMVFGHDRQAYRSPRR